MAEYTNVNLVILNARLSSKLRLVYIDTYRNLVSFYRVAYIASTGLCVVSRSSHYMPNLFAVSSANESSLWNSSLSACDKVLPILAGGNHRNTANPTRVLTLDNMT